MHCLLGSLNFLSLYQCALNLSGVCVRENGVGEGGKERGGE